jgi:hypothetical protein
MIKDSDGEQRFYGIYRGTVANASDPEKQNRLKLNIPQVLGTEETGWAWPYRPSGIHVEVPVVGQGVWVMFEGGDVSFPIWLGVFGKTKNSNTELNLASLTTTQELTPYLVIERDTYNSETLNLGKTLAQLSTRAYGSFYDTTAQYQGGTTTVGSPAVINTPTAMRLNTTDFAHRVRIADGTKITMQDRGIYNLQFSAQLDKTDSGTDTVDIWLRHNGIDVPNSATRIDLTGNNAKAVAAWNWLILVNSNNQNFEIMWASGDGDMRIYAEAAQTSPFAHPGIPSVIVTVDQVGMI